MLSCYPGDPGLEGAIPLITSSSTSDSPDESGSSSRALSHSFWFPTTKTKKLAFLGLASAIGIIVGAPVGSAVTYVAMGGSWASLTALLASNITTFAPLASTTPAPPLNPSRKREPSHPPAPPLTPPRYNNGSDAIFNMAGSLKTSPLKVFYT